MVAASNTRRVENGGDAFLDLGDSEWRCLQCGKFLERYAPAPSDGWNAMRSTVMPKKEQAATQPLTQQPIGRGFAHEASGVITALGARTSK
jgi:hypothetical protein